MRKRRRTNRGRAWATGRLVLAGLVLVSASCRKVVEQVVESTLEERDSNLDMRLPGAGEAEDSGFSIAVAADGSLSWSDGEGGKGSGSFEDLDQSLGRWTKGRQSVGSVVLEIDGKASQKVVIELFEGLAAHGITSVTFRHLTDG